MTRLSPALIGLGLLTLTTTARAETLTLWHAYREGGDEQKALAETLARYAAGRPGTHVEVSVAREGSDVVVRVRDDGPGIPADLRERLFQRFTRGDASRNRAAGSSTGLGLAIAHAVVAAHDGELSVQSEPGWTQFTVRLPAAPDGPPPAAAQQPHREHLPTA